MSMDVNHDIKMARLEAKLSMIDAHENKLNAIKDWVDTTHKRIELRDKFVEKILELNKDNALYILEHERRLERLEAMLDERCE